MQAFYTCFMKFCLALNSYTNYKVSLAIRMNSLVAWDI